MSHQTREKPLLKTLSGQFSIHRFPPDHEIPPIVLTTDFFTINRTPDELSIVCRASIPLPSTTSEPGWATIKIEGPLDFSLTGLLAELATALASAQISIFAVSTFDTDYILVKAGKLAQAQQTLEKAGFSFSPP